MCFTCINFYFLDTYFYSTSYNLIIKMTLITKTATYNLTNINKNIIPHSFSEKFDGTIHHLFSCLNQIYFLF